MLTNLKRYLRVLMWIWLLGGVTLGILASLEPDVKAWLVAATEQLNG